MFFLQSASQRTHWREGGLPHSQGWRISLAACRKSSLPCLQSNSSPRSQPLPSATTLAASSCGTSLHSTSCKCDFLSCELWNTITLSCHLLCDLSTCFQCSAQKSFISFQGSLYLFQTNSFNLPFYLQNGSLEQKVEQFTYANRIESRKLPFEMYEKIEKSL